MRIRYTGRVNDGTTSYVVQAQAALGGGWVVVGRVTNISPGVWGARFPSGVWLGEYGRRSDAGTDLADHWYSHH